jgi:hypothetical protein
MTESQVAMILEKIKRKETKEAEQTNVATTTLKDTDALPELNVKQVKDFAKKYETNKGNFTKTTTTPYDTKGKKLSDYTEFKEAEQTNVATTKLTDTDALPELNVKQAKDFAKEYETNKGTFTKTTTTPYDTKGKKLSDYTEFKEEVVEGKKKKKKYNPWAVCTASVGRKNKKKFEDCVMGVKKKLKEGRNPYEYLIESKMEEIVENNLSPKMTKGEIMSIIAEKKMMMKKPIGTMIGGEMGEGDTKTAPAPTRTTPKTDPGTKPSHPGRRSKEQPNPKPKAKKSQSDSEMESKKSEIITAISNLIDKALK